MTVDRSAPLESASNAFDALADYLRTNAAPLMEKWRARATKDATQPACRHNLTGRELDNHLPILLSMLAETLSQTDTPAAEQEGAEHGHQRRALSYTVPEVVQELSLFREVVLAAVEDFNAAAEIELTAQQLATVRLRLLRLLDRSVNASVDQCVRETEEARREAERCLEESNAALREADAQKGRFLMMLSHELRNPLAAILSAAQVIKCTGSQDPVLSSQQCIIERQARHLAKLVDDLVDVNRISHGKIELKPSVLQFQDAVSLAIESCRPGIDAKHLDLVLELAAEPLHVFADPTRLAQAVANLLQNAVKFTPAGGSIRVAVTGEDREVTLRVKDTGIGISPEMLPHVFDLFAQADTSLHRKAGGLGVGLMVARTLIAMQGGRIDAYSDGEGTGSEFVIRFPLALAEPAPDIFGAPPQRAEQSTPSVFRRVVLVEDNLDAREAMGMALQLFGHDVSLAASGEEAIRLAGTAQPDVFIIDIGLPDMDGFEVARRLRELPAGRKAVLVALSGYGSPRDKARAHDAGFDVHITKPADAEGLHALISRASRDADV